MARQPGSDELNDLPIRVVEGTTIFLRDVAYAHSGAPPRIRHGSCRWLERRLDDDPEDRAGVHLDVINGVKGLLPKIRETMPAGMKLDAINDQSSFVNAAVNSVIFEGVVAAALTGLMILIFLSSWRSTFIITISIPLASLTSVTLLAAIGETINVMTLGGLALAVGILVDDATVTIENINYHLEQGKDIESAIMDGARQIVIPATVSLLCICIVFVPMFNLGGVAGYLFRPMAEAVVFALVGSYVLSRTLVNTMARFLLAHQVVHGHGEAQALTRNLFSLFQRGFERRFEATRNFYRRLLVTALAARGRFIAGFLVAVACSFALVPYLGQNFFPPTANTQLNFTSARRLAHASRTPRKSPTGSSSDPANRSHRCAGANRRQHRIASQRDQFHLQQFRHGGPRGRRYPDHDQARIRKRSRPLCEEDARRPADAISGHDLRVPARRYCVARSSILVFPRRSTCKLSVPTSTPTTSTRTNSCEKSRVCRALRMHKSSRHPTIQRLASNSTACGRRKLA